MLRDTRTQQEGEAVCCNSQSPLVVVRSAEGAEEAEVTK